MEGDIPSTWETIKEIFFFGSSTIYKQKKKCLYITQWYSCVFCIWPSYRFWKLMTSWADIIENYLPKDVTENFLTKRNVKIPYQEKKIMLKIF